MSLRKSLSLFIIGLLSIGELHAPRKKHTQEHDRKPVQPKTDHAHMGQKAHAGAAGRGRAPLGHPAIKPAKPSREESARLQAARGRSQDYSQAFPPTEQLSIYYVTPEGEDRIIIKDLPERDKIKLLQKKDRKQWNRGETPPNDRFFTTSKGNKIDISDLTERGQKRLQEAAKNRL